MSHERTESASTHGSTASNGSVSPHPPSEGSSKDDNGNDNGRHEHEGLFRAHMTAARLAHTHLSGHDVRARASPVKLRFIRSPTNAATLSPAAGTSRIPLPRSISAPDKLNKGDADTVHEDGVQMASYPTGTPPLSSPIPSSSLCSQKVATAIALDHPHGCEHDTREASSSAAIQQGGEVKQAFTSSHRNTNFPSASSYSSSIVFPTTSTRSHPHTPLQTQHDIQIQSPTPPKRHPLRPILRSPPLVSAQEPSTAQPTRTLPSPSARQANERPSFSALPAADTSTTSILDASDSPVTDVAYLSPFTRTVDGEEDESITPSSAVFTSAFSSPLDSATVPRSFGQQQQYFQQRQQQAQQLVHPTQIINDDNHNSANEIAGPSEPKSSSSIIRKHKYSASNDSIQSRSAARSRSGRGREDTGEEEILLASTTSELDSPYVDQAHESPGLLSGQQRFEGGGSGRLQRSHSFSSSISSMTSSGAISHSESFASSTNRPSGNAEMSPPPSSSNVNHSESFLDLRSTSTATPRQARKASSSSALNANSTPRATPPNAPSSTSAFVTPLSSAKASMASRTATNTNTNTISKLAPSLERKRDGTFGTVLGEGSGRGSDHGSPASIPSVPSPPPAEAMAAIRPPRARREASDQGSINGIAGQLPRSGTVGDLSFSSLDLSEKTKSSPKELREASQSASNDNMAQSGSSAFTPLRVSSTTAISAPISGGSLSQSSSSTRLLPPSGNGGTKAKETLSRSHARRPEAIHHSSSTSSSLPLVSKEVKTPVVPGMEDLSREEKKSWKKSGDIIPPWDVTQPLWYKAPVWGKLPQKGMRAHSATLVPDVSCFSSSSYSSSGGSSSFRTSAFHLSEPDLYALNPVPDAASSLYIFGGCDSKTCFKDLYKLDMHSFQWSKPRTLQNENAPPALRAHSTTYIPPFKSLYSGTYDRLAAKDGSPDGLGTNMRERSVDGHLMFFGGGDGPNYFNDLYLLNLTSMTWSKPRHESFKSPASIPDLSQGSTQTLSSATTSQAQASDASASSTEQTVRGHLPSPRRAHTALWYDKRKELIIFGGGNGSKALNETWILECKDWQNLTWKKVETQGKKPRVRGYRRWLPLCRHYNVNELTDCFA